MTRPSSAITRPPTEIFGRHPGYGFAGIGVSTAIGNFTQISFDLTFPPGLQGLLNWQRTYNSHSGAVGALGPGWTTSFSANLVVTPAQGGLLHHTAASVTFHDEDGRILAFAPDGAGGFARPQDLLASLAQNADGTFTLTYNSGEVWSFDSTGRLTGRSKEGQQVTLTYDSQDLLVSAAHSPSGRGLALSYDANRRLTSVAANDGRIVSFTYSPGTVTDALLESVMVPGGGVYRFESSGSGQAAQIAQITDPDGNPVVANSYDTATTRVTSQQFPTGGGAEFRYDDTNSTTTVTYSPSSAQVTYQADANGRMIKVTDPGGNAATFSYDAHGFPAAAATPGGTSLTQTNDVNGNLLTSDFGGSASTWTYDDANRVTSMTGPAGGITRFAYTGSSHIPSLTTDANGGTIAVIASDGLITSRTNVDGETTTFGYDAASNLVTMTSPLSQTTQYGYDQAGNRTSAAMPSGAISHWSYDGAGRVISYTDPAGGLTQLRYSAAGLLLEQIDPTSASTTFGYDAAGNQTSVTDALGNQSASGYDQLGNMISSTDANGDVTTFGYNNLGQLVSITNAVGAVTEYAYDADGNNITQTGPFGTITASYDSRGNNISVTDATNATVHYGYDAADRLTSITDATGASWQIGYDAVGNVLGITDPSSASARLNWTGTGRLAGTTGPNGAQVTVARDATGRVTEIIDAEGGVTRYVYDPDGRRISVTTPAGLTTRYAYDSAGRAIATIDPRGWITRVQYNARGQKTATIGPSGSITRNRYDAAGHLSETIDPNGSVTRYGYDSAGRLTMITDAKGAITRYGYDKAGHLTSLTDPLNRTTQREYDKSGNLIVITDPSGHAQHMAYDGDGRLTQWSADDAVTVSFTYDKAGRRTSMTDATGTSHYTYDSTGNLLTITGPDGEVITAAYDSSGQRTSLSYPGGLTVGYTYDLNGRLVGLSDSRAGDAVYALDPDGRLITEQLPGRNARRYHYEGGLLHRFAVIHDDHTATETVLSYDPDGRILTQRDGDRVREFRYDPVGQLVYTGLRGDPRDETHLVYDVVGNRVSMRHGNTETRYLYDEADQLTGYESQGRRVEFRYDTSGRQTEGIERDRRRTTTYNGFGSPVEVSTADRDLRETIKTIFDGDGLVAQVVLAHENEGRDAERAASVRYRWSTGDAIPQILTQQAAPALDDAERDQPGRFDADFAYGYGRTFGSSDHTAAIMDHDAYGSAVRTPGTTDWVEARDYDAFGVPAEPRQDRQDEARRSREPRTQDHRPGHPEHPDHPEGLPPAVPELPRFGYRGELAIGSMLDLRARMYSPGLGRFTVPDPLLRGAPRPGQQTNPYVYAGNDPVNSADPLGTFAIIPAVPAAQVRSMVPAARGTQTNATNTITNTLSLAAAGATGDLTTLHTGATFVAMDQLLAQMQETHGFFPSRIGIEERLPGAPKSRLRAGLPPLPPGAPGASYGKADIFFAYDNLGEEDVYIWEVKSGIDDTYEAAANQAMIEGRWYANAYNQISFSMMRSSLAETGPPMATTVYVDVLGFADLKVFSLPGTFGAVVYDLDFGSPRWFPVYVYNPKTKDLKGPVTSPGQARAVQIALGSVGAHLVGAAALTAGAAGAAAIIVRIFAALGDFAFAF